MSVTETFHGYIETTRDSLVVFEACRRGLLPRVSRRLQEKERQLVRSGAVFCFDENESGIKRWTDGLVWSPSRILGNFLVYRELDKRTPQNDLDNVRCHSNKGLQNLSERQRERALVGSLTSSYRFKQDGLIKKSMSLVVNGVPQHLISYYSKEDVLANRLKTPSSIPELASLEISPELLLHQNFRVPLFLDAESSSIVEANSSSGSTRSANNNVVQPQQQPQQNVDHRKMLVVGTASNNRVSRLLAEARNKEEIDSLLDRSIIRQKRRMYNNGRRNSSGTSTPPHQTRPLPQPVNNRNRPVSTSLIPHQSSNGCSCARANSYPLQQEYMAQEQSSYPVDNTQQQNDYITAIAAEFAHQHLYDTTNEKEDERPASSSEESTSSCSSTFGAGSYPSRIPYSPASFVTGYRLDRQEQNPHQHLFSSSSLHTINHAAMPLRTDAIANAFMFDPNVLLGTGWNDFDIQL